MPAFKQPTFQDRAAAAAKAKEAALAKLRDKPPVDEAAIAERKAREEARQAEKLRLSEEKRQYRELEKEEKAAARLAAEEEAARLAAEAEARRPKPRSEAEMKALRDAKYAARKARVGRR